MTTVRLEGRARTWDTVLTVLFAFVVLLLAVALPFFAQGFGIMFSSCRSSQTCSLDQYFLGKHMSTFVPLLVAAITIPVTFVQLRQGRVAFWLPLLGAALMTVAFYGGAMVAFSASP